jgi:excisionase family DNA binding protein
MYREGNRMEKLLLTPEEAGLALGLGRSRTYNLLAAGKLPSIRVGRSVRIPAEALRAWVDQQTAKTKATTPTAHQAP